jgi:heme-degrading monooxygenase HmoA
MIVRVWRGRTTAENAGPYLDHVTANVLPTLQSIRGFAGLRVLQDNGKHGAEFLVTSQWDSMDAIRAFAGSDPELAVIEPAAMQLLSDYDSFVRHFRVAFESL